jgi:hypothetical protein
LFKAPFDAIEGHTLNVALHDDYVSAVHLSDQNPQGNWAALPNIIVFDKKFNVRTHVVAMKPNDEVLDRG